MTFYVTPNHAAIYEWVDAPTSKAAIIEAVAGAGKSSTLIEILRRLPESQSACFLAFGKDAAAEIGEKAKRSGLVRPGIEYRTINSMGFRSVIRSFRGVRLDQYAVSNRLRAKLNDDDIKTFRVTVEALVAAAKSQGLIPAKIGRVGLLPDVRSSWRKLVDDFDIKAPGDDDRSLFDRAVEIARDLMTDGLRDLCEINYDDQLYVPWALKLPMAKFDWLLLDEAQDCNGVQRAMIGMALAKDGRLIAVGDPKQAIFNFRGADSDSLERIGIDYGAKVFPLSVTYRCPTKIVKIAQQWVPHLRAVDGAPAGVVREVEGALKTARIDWLPTDLVVCRLNGPLTKLAYGLMKRRIPCRIAGRDIGKGMLTLVRKLEPWDVSDLIVKTKVWRSKEEQKILRRFPDDESKLEALNDKIEALLNLCADIDTIEELRAIIEDLFSDENKGRMTLSSIHKAKGAEAPRVFILDPHLMPSGMARTAEARQQEKNLQYVATTRARHELVYLTPDPDKRDDDKRKREARR